jgi:hypothetical protein
MTTWFKKLNSKQMKTHKRRTQMTKLEELKAAAYEADAAYTAAYQAELKKTQKENTND